MPNRATTVSFWRDNQGWGNGLPEQQQAPPTPFTPPCSQAWRTAQLEAGWNPMTSQKLRFSALCRSPSAGPFFSSTSSQLLRHGPLRASVAVDRLVVIPSFTKVYINIPDRIRTCNLRLRRPTLYPIELRGRDVTIQKSLSATLLKAHIH